MAARAESLRFVDDCEMYGSRLDRTIAYREKEQVEARIAALTAARGIKICALQETREYGAGKAKTEVYTVIV